MPEGHTLHRLAGQLLELVGHQVAATSPQGRFDARQVDGAVVHDVQAYGKHLLIALRPAQGSDSFVHVHLGMRGKWLRFAPVTGPGLKQVRLRLARLAGSGIDVAWDLIAPSTCELLNPVDRSVLLASLGPDPLRADAVAAKACRRLQCLSGYGGRCSDRPGGARRGGQRLRAEILHACRIAPSRPAARVTEAEFAELWTKLQAMMAQSVEDARIITVEVPEGADRLAVSEAAARRVYKRSVCDDCGTPVVTTTLNGRTAYACPCCQPD